MIIFVVFLIALALLAQHFLSKGSLSRVRENFFPEEKVVEPGRSFDLNITVQNLSRRTIPFLRVKLALGEELQNLSSDYMEEDRIYHSRTFTRSLWLKPRQQVEMKIPVKFGKRGRYVLPHLTLSGGDFLGIEEETRTFERFNEVVVAPEEWTETDLPQVLGGFLGDTSVNRWLYEDPVLTVGFREYTGREPMKMISWTQSARSGELLVRKYDHTMEPRAVVLMNVDSPERSCPCLEELCSMARTVCRLLEEKGITYALSTNAALAGGWNGEESSTVGQGGGGVHTERVLELLGRATGQAAEGADRFCERTMDGGGVSSCILISGREGLPDEGALTRLRELSGGNLLVLTPPEQEEGAE